MFGHSEKISSFGHICEGGGASITNSPINLHIHIHAGEVNLITKIYRGIHGAFTRGGIRTIENTEKLTQDDVQGCIIRELEGGGPVNVARECDHNTGRF